MGKGRGCTRTANTAEDAADSVLGYVVCVCFLCLFFSLFVVLVKNSAVPLPSCEWAGPAQASSSPALRCGAQSSPSWTWWGRGGSRVVAPMGLELLLPGRTEQTEWPAPIFKYIYVCVYRKNQEQEPNTKPSPAQRLPSPTPFSKNNQEKKFIKISCRNSLKFTVACRHCTHRPAPQGPIGCVLRAPGPRPTLPETHRQTDRQTDGRKMLLLPLP